MVKTSDMQTSDMLTLARTNLGGSMESSARLCLADAEACAAKGDEPGARRRALDSLRYSVGVFHPAYKSAVRA